VIFAHGSRFGGHSLFIKDKKLNYVYNFLGIKPEQKFVSPKLKPGKYTLGMEFTREKAGPHRESLGQTKLYVNDKVVAVQGRNDPLCCHHRREGAVPRPGEDGHGSVCHRLSVVRTCIRHEGPGCE
jgi:hypothetical protein